MREGAINRFWIVVPMLAVAACSSLSPIEGYRDLTGASKNDELDADPRNLKNYQAGSEEPYPNLATVPGPPERALSATERAALEQSLIADRTHAPYTDDNTPVPPRPTLPPRPRQTAAVPPSSRDPLLAGPATRTPPEGETPIEPPKPPDLPASKRASYSLDSPPQVAAPPVPKPPQITGGNARPTDENKGGALRGGAA